MNAFEWMPLVRICTYGQNKEDDWDRSFRYVFSEVTRNTIGEICEIEAEKMGLDKWYSWGIDSRVAYKHIGTEYIDEVGRLLFLDCDVEGRGGVKSIDHLMSMIRRYTCIDVEPDIYKSENGVHFYYFQVISEDELLRIMDMSFIDDLVDPKFIYSTKKLGSSVLRLSDKKKGEESIINPWMINGDVDDNCNFVKMFITRMLNGVDGGI